MQDGRLQVVNVDSIVGDVISELVGLPEGSSPPFTPPPASTQEARGKAGDCNEAAKKP